MHFKVLYGELPKTGPGWKCLTYRRSPCILYSRSEDPCGKILASFERIPTCLVDHWKFWDRKLHVLDTKARTLFLGWRTPQRSHGMLLWRTLADYCPAHVTFVYHSNSFQSPLETDFIDESHLLLALHRPRELTFGVTLKKKRKKYQKIGTWWLFICMWKGSSVSLFNQN